MHVNKKKLPRKTKLVPRDCKDMDDVLLEMQISPKKLKNMVEVPAPIKFSVNVEVEEYSGDLEGDASIPNIPTEDIKPGSNACNSSSLSTIKCEPQDISEVNISNGENTGDSDEGDEISQVSTVAISNKTTPKFLLKDICESSDSSIKQCTINVESVLQELDELSKIYLNMTDRILVVQSRNSWGNTHKVILSTSRAENQIQNTLKEWKKWTINDKFRREPLMYKCYLCKKAWWHLYSFREHLEENHNVEQLKCFFEQNVQESYIVANIGGMPQQELFPIDSDCWRCGNNYDFHCQTKCRFEDTSYRCSFCELKFYTCTSHMEHLSSCIAYRKILRQNEQDKRVIEFYRCFICKFVLTNKDKLHKHYINFHCVRSDLPVANTVKVCTFCNANYVDKLFHKCNNRNYSIMCTGCMQRFPTKVARDAHRAACKKNFRCRICNYVLDSDCMETKHLVLNHSNNFQILYKCLTCKGNVFLLDYLSTKKHTVIWHKKKRYDKRRNCSEMVVMPIKCISLDKIKEMNIATLPSESQSSDNGLSEVSQIEKNKFKNNKKQQNKPSVDENNDIDLAFKIIEDESYGDIDTPKQTPEESPFANVVLHVKTEKGTKTTESNSNFTNLRKNTAIEMSSNKIGPEENLNFKSDGIKVEKDQDIKKTNQQVNCMVDAVIKQEPDFEQDRLDDDYEMLLSKVFGGSHSLNSPNLDSVKVKEELEDEELFEDDIIVLAQHVESETVKESVSDTPTSEQNEAKPGAPTVKRKKEEEEVSISMQSKRIKNVIKAGKKKCTQCKFVGSNFECSKHISRCKNFYECTKCKDVFCSMEGYVDHFIQHGVPSNSCPSCGMEVKNLVIHIQMHIRFSFLKIQLLESTDNNEENIDLLYKCKECKDSVDIERLFEHWEGHLSLNKVEEQLPDVELHSSLGADVLKTIKEILLLKTDTHQRLKRACVICKRNFYRRNDHKRHLIEHLLTDAMTKFNEVQGLECQLCRKIINKSDPFRRHMRDHASLPIYSCGICSKSFSDSSNFAKHRKTHNFYANECEICGKKFHSDLMLNKHKVMHKQTKPMHCDECDKVFYESSAYRRHIRVKHLAPPYRFNCAVCKMKFDSIRLKWDHMWLVHKQRKHKADCPLCHKKFRKYQDVRLHLRDVHDTSMSFMNNKVFQLLPKVLEKGGNLANCALVEKIDEDNYVIYEQDKDTSEEEDESD